MNRVKISSKLLKISGEMVATRPIQIDRIIAKNFTDRFSVFLGTGYWGRNPDEEMGDSLVFVDGVKIKDVKGDDLKIEVQVKSRDDIRFSDFVLGAGSGKTKRTKRPVILIMINGDYPAGSFLSDENNDFRRQFEDVLLHELSHQADIYVRPSTETHDRILSESELDLQKYYNHPSEVRSYMREIVEQVLFLIPKLIHHFSLNKSIRYGLRESETWKRVLPHLTEQNKDLILKGVYRSVEDYLGRQKAASEILKMARELVSGSRIPAANRGGDCFEAAGRYIIDHAIVGSEKTLVLVHGLVTGQGKIQGVEFSHAWVEDGDIVIDTSNGRDIQMPKAAYYALGHIRKTFRYTLDEARKKFLQFKTYGPWDLKSRY